MIALSIVGNSCLISLEGGLHTESVFMFALSCYLCDGSLEQGLEQKIIYPHIYRSGINNSLFLLILISVL